MTSSNKAMLCPCQDAHKLSKYTLPQLATNSHLELGQSHAFPLNTKDFDPSHILAWSSHEWYHAQTGISNKSDRQAYCQMFKTHVRRVALTSSCRTQGPMPNISQTGFLCLPSAEPHMVSSGFCRHLGSATLPRSTLQASSPLRTIAREFLMLKRTYYSMCMTTQ